MPATLAWDWCFDTESPLKAELAGLCVHCSYHPSCSLGMKAGKEPKYGSPIPRLGAVDTQLINVRGGTGIILFGTASVDWSVIVHGPGSCVGPRDPSNQVGMQNGRKLG